jgi:hypothetical protein
VAAYFWVKEERIDLRVKEERIDRTATEGAIVDASSYEGDTVTVGVEEDTSSDEDGACRKNRPPARPRSEGPVVEGGSLGSGGSSEGSMPSSSYERDGMSNP